MLLGLIKFIDRINEAVGRTAAWLTVIMVVVQFAIVLLRYVYGIGSIALQESLLYMHGALFLLAAGYTLKHGGHVRVEVIYSGASRKTQALVDALGSLLFLAPMCLVTWWLAFPYVELSWAIREGSIEASGLQAVYLLKTVILVYVVLLGLQGLSLLLRSVLVFAGRSVPMDQAERGEV